MVPDTKDSKKSRSMLVGFPIFASKMNTQLIEGILKSEKSEKDDRKGSVARDFDFNDVVLQNYSNSNLNVTNVITNNSESALDI